MGGPTFARCVPSRGDTVITSRGRVSVPTRRSEADPRTMGRFPHHIVHANPRDDVDFVALVDRLESDVDRPQELQRLLRAAHPRALVRIRGLAGERPEVWYVYRDGAWTPPRNNGAT